MALQAAESNRVRIAGERELTFGVKNPTLALQVSRALSGSLAANKETRVSNELRADRMVSDAIEVGFMTGGAQPFEFSCQTYDQELEEALCGTYTTPVNESGTDIAITTGPATVTSSSTDLTTIIEEQWCYMTFADNSAVDGWYQFTNITTNSADVIPDPGVAVPSGNTVTIQGSALRNGTVRRSRSIEYAYTDINQFFLFLGQRMSSFSLSMPNQDIVTGSMEYMGTDLLPIAQTEHGDSYTLATTTSVLNSSSNAGALIFDGVVTTKIAQSLDFTLNNGLRSQTGIGSKYPAGIGYGRQTIEGSMNVYFDDVALYQKFLDHEYIGIAWSLADLAGNRIHFHFPKVALMSNTPTPDGIDQDIIEDLTWQAVVGDSGTFQAQVSIVTAP